MVDTTKHQLMLMAKYANENSITHFWELCRPNLPLAITSFAEAFEGQNVVRTAAVSTAVRPHSCLATWKDINIGGIKALAAQNIML